MITITHDGITDTINGWSERTGIPATAIRSRLEYGWHASRILTTPVQKRGSRRHRPIACIKALTAERDALAEKLEKAVETLERIDEASNHYCMTPTYSEGTLRYAHQSTRNLARTTLAELTESQEKTPPAETDGAS